MNQEQGSPQTLDIGLLTLQNCEKLITVCGFSTQSIICYRSPNCIRYLHHSSAKGCIQVLSQTPSFPGREISQQRRILGVGHCVPPRGLWGWKRWHLIMSAMPGLQRTAWPPSDSLTLSFMSLLSLSPWLLSVHKYIGCFLLSSLSISLSLCPKGFLFSCCRSLRSSERDLLTAVAQWFLLHYP